MNEELIDETESKYTYTKIKPTTEILALGRSSQINLGYNDLVHCIQYNIMFFCQQMFLIKTGNEYTCESAIYTYQNSKLIQQKCNIEYYPELNPEPKVLNAGKYLLLGNFPLPWNYFYSKIDEIGWGCQNQNATETFLNFFSIFLVQIQIDRGHRLPQHKYFVPRHSH